MKSIALVGACCLTVVSAWLALDSGADVDALDAATLRGRLAGQGAVMFQPPPVYRLPKGGRSPDPPTRILPQTAVCRRPGVGGIDTRRPAGYTRGCGVC